jgi:hypothetical protein
MVAALKVLHIVVAAAWFGHKLLVPGDIRATVTATIDEPDLFLRRLKRAERLGIVTGLGTLVSGAALWWAIGFDTVAVGVWVGAALVLIAIAVGAIVARPASKRLHAAVRSSDRVEAALAGRQVSSVLGVESILWVGALTAMVL